MSILPNELEVSYEQVPNLGVVIEVSTDLMSWTTWDASGNQPFFGAQGGKVPLRAVWTNQPPSQYFRARLIAP